MSENESKNSFTELLVALISFGLARLFTVVFSVLVVAAVFGLVLSGWRLANVQSAGWVDWLVVVTSVAVLVAWLALGRGSLDDISEDAAGRWWNRWMDRREHDESDD